MPEGCENCERIDETRVAKKMTFQLPKIRVNKTAKIETALRKSHMTIVFLGLHLSANVPPINENRKIGANSATEISDTATGFSWVFSITYKRIE
jgi:hypothetical protein